MTDIDILSYVILAVSLVLLYVAWRFRCLIQAHNILVRRVDAQAKWNVHAGKQLDLLLELGKNHEARLRGNP